MKIIGEQTKIVIPCIQLVRDKTQIPKGCYFWPILYMYVQLLLHHTNLGLVVWCSGNVSDPISEVTVRWARLILRWVTACGQVNHLGM